MNYKRIPFILIIIVFTFYTCKDEQTYSDLNMTEKKKLLMDLSDHTSREMKILNNGDFTDALNSFTHYINITGLFEGEQGFDYSENAGIYVWDTEISEWSITDTSFLKFFYPSRDIEERNYLLTVSSFKDTSFTFNDSTVYYPGKIDAEIAMNNSSVIFTIDFSAEYRFYNKETRYIIPRFITSRIKADDYYLNFQLNDFGHLIDIQSDLQKKGVTVASLEGKEIFNREGKDKLGMIDGNMQLGDVEMQGNINFAKLSEEMIPDTMSFNEAEEIYTDVSLYRHPSFHEIGYLHFEGEAMNDLQKVSILSDTTLVGTAKSYYDPMVNEFNENRQELDLLMNSFIGEKAIDVLDIIWKKVPM